MPYVALHNHNYYSLLDSTMAPGEIAEAAEYEKGAVVRGCALARTA